jgi:hypothetical protein
VLEGVGCTDPDILGHCRRAAEHVWGCWLVDLLLGWHKVLIRGGPWS